jgi:transcriptional regulator with XRE-family HTH domain
MGNAAHGPHSTMLVAYGKVATMTLGAQIRRIRMEQGLTLSELAIRIPCAKSYLSAIEQHQKRPTPQFLRRVEIVLGLRRETFKSEDEVQNYWAETLLMALIIGTGRPAIDVAALVRSILELLSKRETRTNAQTIGAIKTNALTMLEYLAGGQKTSRRRLAMQVVQALFSHSNAKVPCAILTDILDRPLTDLTGMVIWQACIQRYPDLVAQAMCHPNADVRVVAVRAMHCIRFRRDADDLAFKLDVLARCFQRCKPDDPTQAFKIIDGLFALTLDIFVSAYQLGPQGAPALAQLRAIWRPAILAFTSTAKHFDSWQWIKLGKALSDELLEKLIERLKFQIEAVDGLMLALIFVKEYQRQLRPSEEQVRLCKKLLKTYQNGASPDLAELEKLCMQLFDTRLNLLAMHVAFSALVAAQVRDPVALLPVLQRLYAHAREVHASSSGHGARIASISPPYLLMAFQNTRWEDITDDRQRQAVLAAYADLEVAFQSDFGGTIHGHTETKLKLAAYWSELSKLSHCIAHFAPRAAPDNREVIDTVLDAIFAEENAVGKIRFHLHHFTLLAWSWWGDTTTALQGVEAIDARVAALANNHPCRCALESEVAVHQAYLRSLDAAMRCADAVPATCDFTFLLSPVVSVFNILGDGIIAGLRVCFRCPESGGRDFVAALLAGALNQFDWDDALTLLAKMLVTLVDV